MTYVPTHANSLLPLEQPEPESDVEPSKDFSWILIGIDRAFSGHVLDAAQGFYDHDLFQTYMDAEEAGIVVSQGITPGAYKIININIAGGGPDHNGEYWGPEITGDWENLTLDYAYD